MLILATPGEQVPLVLCLPSGAPGFFPRASVFDLDGNPVGAPIDLSFVSAGGYYLGAFVVPEPAKFTVIYTVFGDAGHTADLSSQPDLGRRSDLIVANLAGTTPPVIASGLDPFR